MFATVRSLNGEFKPTTCKLGAVKDHNGNILTEEKEVQERWMQYTQQLYSRDPNMTDQCNLQLNDSKSDILRSEVEWALKSIACKKSPGTHSVEDLKLLLGQVKRESGNHGLYLNLKKTKIMSNTDLDSFTLDGEGVEVVNSFVFLGSTILKDGGSDLEVRRRLSLGRAAINKLISIMKSHDISKKFMYH